MDEFIEDAGDFVYHIAGGWGELYSEDDRVWVRYIYYDRTPLSDAFVCGSCVSVGTAVTDVCDGGDAEVCEVRDMEATSAYGRGVLRFLDDCDYPA